MEARPPLLTARELNRAVLAGQHLLERAHLALDAAVEAVGALQAQYAPAPPVALWSRVRDVTLDGYRRALEERRLVTALLMRGTLHVVSAREYWAVATALHDAPERPLTVPGSAGPVDVEALRADLAALARDGRLTQDELNAYLRRWLAGRGHDPEDPDMARAGRYAWRVVRGTEFVLNLQSRGEWGERALDAYAGARTLLEPPPTLEREEALTALVRHHLRAFGPAATEDVRSWIGGVRPAALRSAVAALAPDLVRFRDEAGRVLLDLADAPRPGADVPAPVRYLPWFDSLLLAYAPRFRGRVLPEQHRPAVIRTANLQVLPTFLVDGMVAGTREAQLRRKAAAILVRPFGRLPGTARRALRDEGERLGRFLEPQAASHEVVVVDD